MQNRSRIESPLIGRTEEAVIPGKRDVHLSKSTIERSPENPGNIINLISPVTHKCDDFPGRWLPGHELEKRYLQNEHFRLAKGRCSASKRLQLKTLNIQLDQIRMEPATTGKH